jgi:Na+/H+ antiporter NhaC
MTDEQDVRKRAVAAVLSGVARKTAVIVSAAAVAALVLSVLRGDRWWFLPASVLFGGVLGVLNFRWLAIAVQRVYLRDGATPGTSNLAAAIISILKLSIIFIILFIVIKWQLLHVFGLVAGLTLCFFAIIWQGASAVRDTLREKNSEQ